MSNALTLTALKAKAKAVRAASLPRMIFGLDATASRRDTWTIAQRLQRDLLTMAQEVGQLELQIAFFSGLTNFRHTHWSTDGDELAKLMSEIHCQAGQTQIVRLFDHAIAEATAAPTRVKCLLYVGDTMEDNEAQVLARAKTLGDLNVPIFMLYEKGQYNNDEPEYRRIAKASGGAFGEFSEGGIAELRSMLEAIFAYATGGKDAMRRIPGALLLLEQMK